MARTYQYAGRTWVDPRGTRAWRRLVATVVAEEPTCWLRLPDVCTLVATTADHLLPVTVRPDLAMTRTNLRGACQPCNEARKAKPIAEVLLLKSSARPDALGLFD